MPVQTNSTVSAAAVDGAVRHYKVERGGAGYTTGTYTAQTLQGDSSIRGGTAATFTVTVDGGVVTKVVMVNE